MKHKRRCKFCGKEFLAEGKSKYCSHECMHTLVYKIPTLVKYFGYNVECIGTSKAYIEYKRIRTMLYDLYWLQHKSSSEIAKMFNYTKHIENITNKVFKMLDIPKKTLSQSQSENLLYKRTSLPNYSNYKSGYHTTWNGKKVFYRSSYELDYAKQLDNQQIDYDVELFRIKYYDTQLNKFRIAIPDFYIPSENMLVEIKSSYTLDTQNMHDKFSEYAKLGYKTKLIVDFEERYI